MKEKFIGFRYNIQHVQMMARLARSDEQWLRAVIPQVAAHLNPPHVNCFEQRREYIFLVSQARYSLAQVALQNEAKLSPGRGETHDRRRTRFG